VFVCLFGTPRCHEISPAKERSRMASEDLKSSEDGPSKGWGLEERRLSIFEIRDAVSDRILCLMFVILFLVSRSVASCWAELAKASARTLSIIGLGPLDVFSMCDGIQ